MKDSVHDWILYLAILLSLLVLLAYVLWGYHLVILVFWILSLGIFGYFFWQQDSLLPIERRIVFRKQDWIFLGILGLLFIPIYLYDVYHLPVQVNTDEIVISSAARRLTSERFPDLFGLDEAYYYFPKFSFILHGSIARLWGGVTLGNMRIIHASLGFLIVITSYFFFRAFRDPVFSLFGSIVLGSNHALIAISRMAMRDNGPVMIELISFLCLFEGLKRKSNLLIFMGGITMGLSLYGYFPGRVIPVLWGLFLGLIVLFLKDFISRDFLKKIAISGWGACLTAAPILVSTFRSPSAGSDYAKTQLLFFEAGRAFQQDWIKAATPLDGVKKNIINGLTVFNNKQLDLGYIYPNEGHGFVDPITGILVWLGVVLIVRKLISKSIVKQEILQSIFILSSFFLLYFLFAFALTKTPNYTRLLILLPFIGYLGAEGLTSLAKSLDIYIQNIQNHLNIKIPYHNFGKIFTSLIVALVFGSNLWIFRDFLVVGWKEGNNVGGTIRYIESKRDQETYSFYLSASSAYPYYSWGTSEYWRGWTAAFSRRSQATTYIRPDQLKEYSFTLPCTIFLQRRLWEENKSFLDHQFPDQIQITPITPDKRLLAIEINP